MQQETSKSLQGVREDGSENSDIHGFRLFEEFSKENIDNTITRCRETFEKADPSSKRYLVEKVEMDVECFFRWLTESKGYNRFIAHYYATSLKSALLGLGKGVEVGLLFGITLSKLERLV